MARMEKTDSLQNVYATLGAGDGGVSTMDSLENEDEAIDSKLCFMASADREDKWLRDCAMEAALTDVAEIVSTATTRRQLTRENVRGDALKGPWQSSSRDASTAAGDKLEPPSILVLIHALTSDQSVANVRVAMEAGATGVVLCNYDFDYPQMLPILRNVRGEFPKLFLGVKFPGLNGAEAFPILGKLAREGTRIDACWTDNAQINHQSVYQERADHIESMRTQSGWGGVYFGGVAGSNPRGNPRLCQHVPTGDLCRSAELGSQYMDVVCTCKREALEIAHMRKGCGETPLAVAGALTEADVSQLMKDCDCFVVECGNTGPEKMVDGAALQRIIAAARAAAPS